MKASFWTEQERNTIRNRLIEYRSEQRMSQEELANAIGCSRATIQAYEAGRICPPPLTLSAIAIALSTNFDYLTGHSSDPNPNSIYAFGRRLSKDDITALRKYGQLTTEDRETVNVLIDRLSELEIKKRKSYI